MIFRQNWKKKSIVFNDFLEIELVIFKYNLLFDGAGIYPTFLNTSSVLPIHKNPHKFTHLALPHFTFTQEMKFLYHSFQFC